VSRYEKFREEARKIVTKYIKMIDRDLNIIKRKPQLFYGIILDSIVQLRDLMAEYGIHGEKAREIIVEELRKARKEVLGE